MPASPEEFRQLPKAELHVHLDGSLRPATVWELAQEARFYLPFDSVEELERHLRVPRRCTLPEYLRAFEYTVGVMQEREALARVAREFVEDVAADGVRYVEVRFAPALHRGRGLDLERVVESVLDGLAEGQRRTGTVARLICCAMRQQSPRLSEAVARVAVTYRSAGVVALDLAGPEEGYPPEPHRKALEHALEHGLHLTVHAGEACCPDHVRRSIELGAERIGHGTYLGRDPAGERLVRERRIPLEVCPTSNLQIAGFIRDYADHPLHGYLERGLTVTLNTDNRLMSNVTLSDEFAHLVPRLSPDQARSIARHGFEVAFLPADEKQALLDALRLPQP